VIEMRGVEEVVRTKGVIHGSTLWATECSTTQYNTRVL
jgi:hypothetical protein